jgi:ubiquinone/menaquinone biosynthesis C-methylase UbiE
MRNDKKKMDEVYRERKRLASRYSLDNPGNRFNIASLLAKVSNALHTRFSDLSLASLLDIGSGDLFWVEEFVRMGVPRSACVGSDLLDWRLREGRGKGRNIASVVCTAAQLPFRTESFDLVSQFTLMTSITDDLIKDMIAIEMKRVLKPGGYILWYDFRYNNPTNPHTRAIGRSEIRRLFAGWNIEPTAVTLIPQVARKTPGRLVPLLKFLHRLPILRTHYLALIGPKG